MRGSTVALVSSEAPDIVRSVQGEASHAQAGCSSPAARSRLISEIVRLPPALSPPTAMSRAEIPCLRRNAPRRHRILVRRRIRMLGRKPVVDREREHARRAARLGHHPAMADDRARAISAAVKEHQHARGIAAWHDRPFTLHAAEIDRLEPHVIGDRPGRADFVDPLRAARSTPRRGLAFSNLRTASISCWLTISPA